MPLLTFMRGYIGCMTKLNFDVGYFLDITNAESFSLCITINLHQTLHVHTDLVILVHCSASCPIWNVGRLSVCSFLLAFGSAYTVCKMLATFMLNFQLSGHVLVAKHCN